MTAAPRFVCAALLALAGIATAHAASVTWDGGGGDFSWQNRTNWSGDELPTTADDAVINISGNVTIITSSNVTIRSVQSSNNLTLAGGTFRVTAGASIVHGRLSVTGNYLLAAAGAGTLFASAGEVLADGAAFEATSGAKISLPGLAAYSKGSLCRLATWRATGAGSALEFPGLATLNGGSCLPVEIQATSGGIVSLTNLASIAEGLVSFLADGANSRVELGALQECLATQRDVIFEARNGGAVAMPQFPGGPTVRVRLINGGVLPVAQLRRLGGFTVTAMAAEFSALTNLTFGSVLVSGGAVVTLPSLTSHDNGTGCQVNRWQASGAGSVLDLSPLTRLNGSGCGVLEVEALAGGMVVLSNLTALADGRLSFSADGANSRVDLGALRESLATSRSVAFEARNAGTMWIPQLPGGLTVSVTLESGGVLPVAQLRQLSGFTVMGMAVDFPALTNLAPGNLTVRGGAVVTLPNLTSHDHGTGCFVNTWEASGTGSVLNLSSLTQLSGADCGVLEFEALAGGTILLNHLPTLTDGRLSFLADGANSRVDLGALQQSLAASRSVDFVARNAGTVWTPLLQGGPTVTVTLQSGGVMPVTQMDSLRGLNLSGTTLELTEITNLFAGNLTVSGGAVLRLPNISRHDHGNNCSVNTWEVNGAGSALDLSSMTTLTGANCGELAIHALAGGMVNLSNLTTIAEGLVSFLADGSNSLVNLDTLRQSLATSRSVAFEARNRGVISMPQMIGGPTVSVILRSNGVMPVAQMGRLGGITVAGATVHFVGLTNFDGGRIVVSNAAMVTAPNLLTFAQDSDCSPDSWLVRDPGSVLDLSGLARLTGANCGVFDLQALSGGQLRLGGLTNIPTGNVSVLSSGGGSVVDLSALANFLNPLGLSRLTATNGGVIMLNAGPSILSGVSIQITAGAPNLPPTTLAATNLILHATPWRSYWVETRDTTSTANPWQFLRRVPLTNEFQIIAPRAVANREFRAAEFVADPFALELTAEAGVGVAVVLYGPANRSFEVQAVTNLVAAVPWPAIYTVAMTNTFRILPSEPLTTPRRFFQVNPLFGTSP